MLNCVILILGSERYEYRFSRERRKKGELFFNIVNKDNNDIVGILFTVENHIAYEVYEEYRNQGIATDALKQITGKIDRPILEIKYDNMALKQLL